MNFDVLSRSVCLNQHHFIEASAGTGKTFTIEHLFVRRLIEPTVNGKYVVASEIAVLTFTRAVARELVVRVRRCLDQAIAFLSGPADDPNIPDYLKCIFEQSKESVMQAKWRLQAARADLDLAQITTIHGFCAQVLSDFQENLANCLSASQMREMVKQFFASKLQKDKTSVLQLSKLLGKYRYDFSELCREVISKLHEEWFDERSFEENETLLDSLRECVFEMKRDHGWSELKVSDALEALTFHFKECRKKTGELNEGLQKQITFFSKLFSSCFTDSDIENAIRFPFIASLAFSAPKVQKKNEERDLHLIPLLMKFEPILSKLSDPQYILDRLAARCRLFVREQMKQKQLFSHDELLYQMNKALDQESFRQYLGSRFSSVIVDEFQDTDPLQWKIISRGLLEQNKTTVFLVGDPKQAIYSFRKADVYSYIQAKKEIKGAVIGSLCTNFRSTPPLVDALNTLFAGSQSSSIFFLPKLGQSLEAIALFPGLKEIDGDKEPVHFFVAHEAIGRKRTWPTKEMEQDVLFPFIACEIASKGSKYSQCAVLVKDRHQAERLESFLSGVKIPTRAWRRPSIINSRAHKMLERLFLAILAPKDRSRLLQFLSNEPLLYSDEECLKLQDEAVWAEHVVHLLMLRKSYEEGALPLFFQRFLSSPWTNEVPMQECIQGLQEGSQLLRDLELFFDILLAENSLEKTLEALASFRQLTEEEQEIFSSRFDDQEEAVQIVTMHSSKGLEFDYVFALGLASRSPFPADQEEEAEKLRQFYVACTRAKKKLYLPVVIDDDGKIPHNGTASPMELFLACFGNRQCEVIDHLRSQGGFAVSELACQKNVDIHLPAKEPIVNANKVILDAEYQRLYFHSFSRMKTYQDERAQKLPEGIVSGPEVGLVLHELLASFLKNNCIDRLEEMKDFVRVKLLGTALQGHEDEVFDMLKRAFHAPLPSPHTAFCLADVDLKKSFCEMPFLFDEDGKNFVRGTIDFIFEKDGYTYLLDWKSNWLGPNREDYRREHLEKAVVQNQYDLQAKIYSQAWLRYLDTNQKMKFGGFFFVFLRGLMADSSGILFFNPFLEGGCSDVE